MIVNEMYARSRYEGYTVYRETERRVDEGILERETERERIKKKEYKSQTRARTLANRRIYIYTRGGGNAGQFFNGSGRA